MESSLVAGSIGAFKNKRPKLELELGPQGIKEPEERFPDHPGAMGLE